MKIRDKLIFLSIFRWSACKIFLLHACFLLFRYCENAFGCLSLLSFAYIKKKLSHHSIEILNKNKIYRDLHKGSSAFLLATGPSLALFESFNADNSQIIAINEAFYFLKEQNRFPNYLILDDDLYFTESRLPFMKELLHTSRVSNMKLVFPLKHKKMIEQLIAVNGYQPIIIYYATYSSLMTRGGHVRITDFDFSQPVLGFPTASHVALAFTVYLGLAKVFLLGIDMDYVLHPDQPIKHGYDHIIPHRSVLTCAEEYQNNMNWNYKDLLYNTWIQIRCYEVMRQVALRKGVQIYNLSPSSILQVYPFLKMDLKEKIL